MNDDELGISDVIEGKADGVVAFSTSGDDVGPPVEQGRGLGDTVGRHGHHNPGDHARAEQPVDGMFENGSPAELHISLWYAGPQPLTGAGS
jgi:hypothetical protein